MVAGAATAQRTAKTRRAPRERAGTGRAQTRDKRAERAVVVVPSVGGMAGGDRAARARYDLVQPSRDHDRRFAGADLLDVVRANSASVRARARSRARHVIANGCHARGMVETVANDMVGTGPRLQMLTNSKAFNREVQQRWREWSDAVSLAGHLRTARKARIQDGEAFLLPFTNPDLMLDGIEASPVTLDLRAIEADQVESPVMAKAKYTEGIRFSDRGVPLGYSVLKEHPGGLMAGSGYIEVPREEMIHWFRVDRAGQIRGYPEIGPAVALYEQLRCYVLAVLSSAELAACFTAFLKTQAGTVDVAGKLQSSETGGEAAFTAVDIERAMLTILPDGQEVQQLKPEQPAATFEMFVKALLMEVARVLSIPYCVAAGSSQGLNYASGRLDFKAYYRTLRVDQEDCERRVLNRIFAMWFREALLVWPQWIERMGTAGLEGPRPPHAWFWIRDEHVDPLKEAGAQQIRLRSHTTTLEAEYAAVGRDWEEELDQRRIEIELMRKYALPLDEEKAPGQGQGPEPEEKDEE